MSNLLQLCVISFGLIFSTSLSAMEKNSIGYLDGCSAKELASNLLTVKSVDVKNIELTISNSTIDKENFIMLLEILQQDGKIESLKIGPAVQMAGHVFLKEASPKIQAEIKLTSLTLQNMDFEDSNFVKASNDFLFPQLINLKHLKISGSRNDPRYFLQKLLSNKQNITHIDISHNDLTLAGVSNIVTEIMQNENLPLQELITSNNSAEPPKNDQQVKKFHNRAVASCWKELFPRKLARKLVTLDMSGMNLSDVFASIILGYVKEGYFTQLKHLNLSGIRDSEPTKTTNILVDILTSKSFYALETLQFNHPYIDKFNTFVGTKKVEQPPKIMQEIAELLIARGHKCVEINSSRNHELRWCQNDVCLKRD